MKKRGYHRALKEGKLSYAGINRLLNFMRKKGMTLEKISKDLLRELKIAGYLGKFELYICGGKKSWEGLVGGFPGTIRELTPEHVGTPYLRKILYPMVYFCRMHPLEEGLGSLTVRAIDSFS
ncbi:MAG: hypothetical protein ACE5KJ_02320 [Candidatus Zixiibacteriota bacterium]